MSYRRRLPHWCARAPRSGWRRSRGVVIASPRAGHRRLARGRPPGRPATSPSASSTAGRPRARGRQRDRPPGRRLAVGVAVGGTRKRRVLADQLEHATPHQNGSPLLRQITTRRRGRAQQVEIAEEQRVTSPMALCRSGRLRVRTAMPPFASADGVVVHRRLPSRQRGTGENPAGGCHDARRRAAATEAPPPERGNPAADRAEARRSAT